ncbi:equilibrative nucleobase transporter 1-like [Clavelina lepadiformis]|uniref:equilibrative nucleobase transporter 1-like n=1 Tax=Clavelina lepadiformis TaxID=159417 RepID=UPI00404274BF
MAYKCKYWLSAGTAVIEGLFFSGIIFGWSSITCVLKTKGYFSYLCEDSDDSIVSLSNISQANSTSAPVSNSSTCSSCRAQDESINLVFTVASAVLSFSAFPNGYVFDRFGTWVSRLMAAILVTLGGILMSISTVSTSWLLFPAMCSFAIGGILLLVTNMQLGNLFGKARSSVITLLNGALDSSSFVFLLIKLAYENGIDLTTIFVFFSCCTLFLWIRTFILMPRMHIPFPLPKKGIEYGLKDCRSKKQSDEHTLSNKEEEREEMMSADVDLKKSESYWTYLKTGKFWMNVMHFSVLQLRNYFFLGTLVNWLKFLMSPDYSDLGTYLNAFGVCQFFGVLTAPLNGMLIDSCINWMKKSDADESVVTAKAVALSGFVTTTLGVIFSLVVIIPSVKVQYASFILQVLFRSFLYGGNCSFVALLFPSEHFGKLYGMTMTLAGLVTLFQFPLFSLVLRVFESDFLFINVAFMVVCLLTYIHPVTLYYSSCQQQKQSKKSANSGKNGILQAEA